MNIYSEASLQRFEDTSRQFLSSIKKEENPSKCLSILRLDFYKSSSFINLNKLQLSLAIRSYLQLYTITSCRSEFCTSQHRELRNAERKCSLVK